MVAASLLSQMALLSIDQKANRCGKRITSHFIELMSNLFSFCKFILYCGVAARERNRFDTFDDVEYPADVLDTMERNGMDISGFSVATSNIDNQV